MRVFSERLGLIVGFIVPWHISLFMKLVWPFIDPKTKEKVIYNEDMRKYVPPEQLRKSHGGDLEFEYEHDIYWPSLNKLAEERRRSQYERWVRGGKMIGEFEKYLRGGQEESLKSTMPSNEDKIAEKMASVSLNGEEAKVQETGSEKATQSTGSTVITN